MMTAFAAAYKATCGYTRAGHIVLTGRALENTLENAVLQRRVAQSKLKMVMSA